MSYADILKALAVIIPTREKEIHAEIEAIYRDLDKSPPSVIYARYQALIGTAMRVAREKEARYRNLLVNVVRGKIDAKLIFSEFKIENQHGTS